MTQQDGALRAVVVKRKNGLIEAQLLDIDIAVAARTHKELLQELCHAIIEEYNLAVDAKRTPFVNLINVPERFIEMWDERKATNGGVLDLPSHIAVALAAVIRLPQLTLHLSESPKKAA